MEEYALKIKSGETLKIIKANNLEGAIKSFAQLKNLSEEDLLKIYEVEKIS